MLTIIQLLYIINSIEGKKFQIKNKNKKVVNIMNLMERLKKAVSNGLDLMEGREKGEQELNKELTIIEYGYLNGDDGEFITYNVREDDNHFFFGGSVLTERFKHIETCFTEDEIQELLKEGIKIKLSEKKSKNNRKYVSVEFI